jgi:hypothetical protein
VDPSESGPDGRHREENQIRDRPTAPRSPWRNGHAERLIGSIRRECLDHVVVFGERHPRHVLISYMEYYNGTRTHLALNKDAPVSRAIQAVGRILPMPSVDGRDWQAFFSLSFERIGGLRSYVRPMCAEPCPLALMKSDCEGPYQ